MNKSFKKPLVALAAIAALGAGVAGAVVVSADVVSTPAPSTALAEGNHKAPGVMGTVSAINGSTLTVTDQRDTTKSYTVDISNAKIEKSSTVKGTAPTVITASGITVGDKVMVKGTVSGTSVTATNVTDGVFRGGPGEGKGGMERGTRGTVTAMNGTTISVTGKDGKTYTVDASTSKVSRMATISVSDIKVGDEISAQGTLLGTTVTAKNIMDGLPSVQ